MFNPSVSAQDADEIDLLEMGQALWAKKTLIILVTVVVTALAVVYAYVAQPVYESRLFLQPPTYNDIAEINYGRTKGEDLDPFSVKDVYALYIRNLQSEQLRQSFFDDVYLPSLEESQRSGSRDLLYAKFGNIISVAPITGSPDRYSVSVQSSEAEKASSWAQLYASKAGDAAERELIRNVTREARVRARNIDQQIASIRESTAEERKDSIVRLREALRVAESIGLENPPIISGNLTPEISAKMDGPLTYMRGAKALRGEIKNLEERASNDPFIGNLRGLQSRLDFYKQLNVDPSEISMYRQDGNIEQPDQPIKPKKLLIIVLGIVAGLMAGLAMALVSFFMASEKRKKTRQ